MRFLVNENITGTVIQELRQRGHDVLSVKESMRSERDELILARAQSVTDNERILEAVESRSDWTSHFSVVTDDRIRMRPLPSLRTTSEGA